jgi:hypothetical protein
MDHFAGLDVSVKETSVCIMDATGSYACALELGLELCPAEVEPVLRLAYKDQPLSGFAFFLQFFTPFPVLTWIIGWRAAKP